MSRRWFDKWEGRSPDLSCSCGHTLADHPAERFRSCARCVWCDEMRHRAVPLSWVTAADAMGLNDDVATLAARRGTAETGDDDE